MQLRNAAYGLLYLLLSSSAVAQQALRGVIHKRGGNEVLIAVSVQNSTQKKFNQSDMGGNFRIAANPGDTLIFSSAGYNRDTTIVSAWMFKEPDGYLVYLQPNVVALTAVQVDEESNYRMDSIKRKEEYAWLDQVHRVKLAGGKTFSDGVGVSFSPISYFHRQEAQRRKLRKRLAREEKDYYIDYKFPRALVARVTRLQGDSLWMFMNKYRPDYAFCRKASGEDMLLYINDQLKKYRGGGK